MNVVMIIGLLCSLLLCQAVADMQQSRSMPGGTGALKPADDHIRTICAEVRPAVENSANAKFEEFEPVSYKSQVVAGTNYFVKVKVRSADDSHVHIRVFKGLPHTGGKLELHSTHSDKKSHDELVYFDRDEL